MHIVKSLPRRRTGPMNLPYERVQIHDRGLGELEGIFNIGKMFSRMFTFRPKSFSFKNIVGAVGSATLAIGTGGIAQIVAPKATGAHGSVSRVTGAMVVGGGVIPSFAPRAFGLSNTEANWVRGLTAAAAAVATGGMAMSAMAPAAGVAAEGAAAGAGASVAEAGAEGFALTIPGVSTSAVGAGTVLTEGSAGVGTVLTGTTAPLAETAASGGFWSTIGGAASDAGSGLWNVAKTVAKEALPKMLTQALTGGSQQPQQQQDPGSSSGGVQVNVGGGGMIPSEYSSGAQQGVPFYNNLPGGNGGSYFPQSFPSGEASPFVQQMADGTVLDDGSTVATRADGTKVVVPSMIPGVADQTLIYTVLGIGGVLGVYYYMEG